MSARTPPKPSPVTSPAATSSQRLCSTSVARRPGERLELGEEERPPPRRAARAPPGRRAPGQAAVSPCRARARIHGRSSRRAKAMGAARVGLERRARAPSGSPRAREATPGDCPLQAQLVEQPGVVACRRAPAGSPAPRRRPQRRSPAAAPAPRAPGDPCSCVPGTTCCQLKRKRRNCAAVTGSISRRSRPSVSRWMRARAARARTTRARYTPGVKWPRSTPPWPRSGATRWPRLLGQAKLQRAAGWRPSLGPSEIHPAAHHPLLGRAVARLRGRARSSSRSVPRGRRPARRARPLAEQLLDECHQAALAPRGHQIAPAAGDRAAPRRRAAGGSRLRAHRAMASGSSSRQLVEARPCVDRRRGLDRPRPPLLERGVVEVGVGPRVRGSRGPAPTARADRAPGASAPPRRMRSQQRCAARRDPSPRCRQSRERLVDQRVIGRLRAAR